MKDYIKTTDVLSWFHEYGIHLDNSVFAKAKKELYEMRDCLDEKQKYIRRFLVTNEQLSKL